MTLNELEVEIQERVSKKDGIRSAINTFCAEKYGIEDFFGIVDLYFPRPSSGKFQICLARQVPTPNIEHIALVLSTRAWGKDPLFLSLTRDSYPQNDKNIYKKSLVSLPELFRGRKGSIVSKNNVLVRERCLQNAIFSQMMIGGISLPDYHWRMMERVIRETPEKVEVGDFFRDILLAATKNLPRFIFVKEGMRERKVLFQECYRNKRYDPRPPADWYYFFYLMIFLDGLRGLASTVDEDPEVIAWFKYSNRAIRDICGFCPQILDTPLDVKVDGFYSKLNEVPRIALNGNGFLNSIPGPPNFSDDLRFFEIMDHFEKEIILLS